MTESRDKAPLLSIRNLSIALPKGGDRPYAVCDTTFDIGAGELVCIVGESGSGKSMSANAIMGLLPNYLKPESGQILFQGRDLLTQDEATLRGMRGKDMAMIFQEPLSALNPLHRVGDQIAEVMRVHGERDPAARRGRVLELLAFVGLPDPPSLYHAYPFALSGGQRQRVMIAMALALEPALLIADEPTTALDVTTQAQILSLIARIQKEKGMGVMFVTHDFGVVAEIADRVIVMEKGCIVEQGPAAQVLNRPMHTYTRRLIGSVPSHRPPAAAPADDTNGYPVLRVEGLRKTYTTPGGLFQRKRVVEAVKGVSFDIRAGETLGIVGESGSGKSTIGKCLLKLTANDGGVMAFEGRDIAPMSEQAFRPLRRHIQMIFQDPFASLNPRHTVGRILCDGPIASGVPRAQAEARARELLKLVELDASAFDRYPSQFSGGQRQRIGARALAMEPRLIVADESVSALDVSVQAQVLKLLADVQKRLGIALIFITHDLRVAAQICNKVLVMHRGSVVEQGSPAEIFESPRDAYTRRLIEAMPGKAWDPHAVQPSNVPEAEAMEAS